MELDTNHYYKAGYRFKYNAYVTRITYAEIKARIIALEDDDDDRKSAGELYLVEDSETGQLVVMRENQIDNLTSNGPYYVWVKDEAEAEST